MFSRGKKNKAGKGESASPAAKPKKEKRSKEKRSSTSSLPAKPLASTTSLDTASTVAGSPTPSSSSHIGLPNLKAKIKTNTLLSRASISGSSLQADEVKIDDIVRWNLQKDEQHEHKTFTDFQTCHEHGHSHEHDHEQGENHRGVEESIVPASQTQHLAAPTVASRRHSEYNPYRAPGDVHDKIPGVNAPMTQVHRTMFVPSTGEWESVPLVPPETKESLRDKMKNYSTSGGGDEVDSSEKRGLCAWCFCCFA